MSKIRVFLADDHAIFRAGVASLLSAQPDIEVVGEAGSVDELLDKVPQAKPDVVLLDLSMPVGGGLRAVEGIQRSGLQVRFIALTMHDDPAYLRSALAAGVSGYLIKSAEVAELGAAIRAVQRGRSYIDVSLLQGGLANLVGKAQASPSAPAGPKGPALSQRERQILKLLALGHTYRETAAKLNLSEKSVETYRARMTEKLGITSRAGLVRYALLTGLLDEENL
jgi:two-component system, NarL family, response regulator NreC